MDPDDAIEYDSQSDAYRTTYETERPSPSLALVEAVAAIEDADPISLEPIGNSLNVKAVDRIIQSSEDDRDTRITLSYQGYYATIGADGVVDLRPTDSDVASPTAD